MRIYNNFELNYLHISLTQIYYSQTCLRQQTSVSIENGHILQVVLFNSFFLVLENVFMTWQNKPHKKNNDVLIIIMASFGPDWGC